jgi:hypothetical protein
MRWAGHICSTHGRGKESVQGFRGKAQRKEPLARPRRKWEDGIKINVGEIGWAGMAWIHLVQERDWWWGLCEHCDEPSGSGATELVS